MRQCWDNACELLKAAGAKRTLPLPVSAPFHSSLMKPAAEKLRVALADVVLAAPQITVLNNVDVAVQQDADAIYRQALGGLFQDPAVDAKQLLRERSVLEHIEEGVNRCERLAKTLSICAVKYG